MQGTIKSEQVRMKSKLSDFDEIKSVLAHPPKAISSAKQISSTAGGFIPSQTDLVEKDLNFYQIISQVFVYFKDASPEAI